MLFALLLSSCGGDDPSARRTSQVVTKPGYLERANAICAAAAGQTRTLAGSTFGKLGRPPSEREQTAYEHRARALQERTLARLRALAAPTGDERRVASIYDAFEGALRELARVPAGKPGPASAPSVDRFERLASAYGLDRCAGGAGG